MIIGAEAGASLQSGDTNTFVGYQCGTSVSSGDHNTLFGYQAGKGLHSAGSHNTLIGKQAGINVNSSGDGNNTCLGSETGDTLTSGIDNTIIGANADSEGTGTNRAIGLGKSITAVQDYFTVGNGTDDIRNSHGSTTWATVSDKRFKKNIETSTAGLSFIEDLRPVTYNWKNKGEIPNWSKAYQEGSEEQYRNSKHNHGFIAQEVKASLDKAGVSEFGGWKEDQFGVQQVSREMFVIPLVKAVQELSTKLDAALARIATLEG